jgi:hypothetical protein
MVAAKSTVRNKRKKRVLVIIAVIKITLFACYFVLKSTKFDEDYARDRSIGRNRFGMERGLEGDYGDAF